jgi:hypothetical protein
MTAKFTDDDWDFFQGDQIWETRQVMLAQSRKIAALEGLVKFQAEQIKDLAMWMYQIHKAVEKSADADKTFADAIEKQIEVDNEIANMLDNLDAQINGLTKRYETHGHITAKGNTTSHPEDTSCQ